VKDSRNDDSRFEERLLDELKAVVAQRSPEEETAAGGAPRSRARRRAPRLAIGGAAVLAAAAAVLALSSGSDNTPKAFAVEPQEGGGVTIKVLSAEDGAGLEAALAEAGISSQVTWLPAGMTCREPRFTPSSTKTALGGTIGVLNVAGPGPALTIGVMSAEQYRARHQEYKSGEISESEFDESTPNISLDPEGFRPDQTVVISGAPGPYEGNPEGGYEARFAVAEGPVEPCQPVSVTGSGMLGEMNGVLESEAR
jgi:hypothetical protein